MVPPSPRAGTANEKTASARRDATRTREGSVSPVLECPGQRRMGAVGILAQVLFCGARGVVACARARQRLHPPAQGLARERSAGLLAGIGRKPVRRLGEGVQLIEV